MRVKASSSKAMERVVTNRDKAMVMVKTKTSPSRDVEKSSGRKEAKGRSASKKATTETEEYTDSRQLC